MIIIYIDILLLIILPIDVELRGTSLLQVAGKLVYYTKLDRRFCLTLFMCGYCFYRINRMRQNGEIAILLRPTKVVFSHKKEGESSEELRTVVAYQNPFTGDYCVHKSRLGSNGYMNSLQPDSPDSGVSDEYEPLNLEPLGPQPSLPHVVQDRMPSELVAVSQPDCSVKVLITPEQEDNSVNKTWNWNYKEYQI